MSEKLKEKVDDIIYELGVDPSDVRDVTDKIFKIVDHPTCKTCKNWDAYCSNMRSEKNWYCADHEEVRGE